MISKCRNIIVFMIFAAISYDAFIKPIMYRKTKSKKSIKISAGKIFGGDIVENLVNINNMDNQIERLNSMSTENINILREQINSMTEIDINRMESLGITFENRINILDKLNDEISQRSKITSTQIYQPEEQTPESSLESYTEPSLEPTVEQPLEQPVEQLVEQPVETAVEQLSDPITEPIKNRDIYNNNDIRMKNIEDLNSAQDIQISNIQDKMTRIEQNIKNIEEDNKDKSIENKMKQSLNQLINENESSNKNIKMNKKNINVNNKNIKKINQLNKTIEELYNQQNVMAEEDEIMVGGNNTIRSTVEKIFNPSMNGGKKENNTQELAVNVFAKQEPQENNRNNYGDFEKNEFFEY